MNDKCCGTCKWHELDEREWVCGNLESEIYAEYTDYEDSCEDWEPRDK